MKLQVLQEARNQLFNPELKLSPKLRTRRENFLIKIPLFSLIYQKKGEQNFQLIIANIRIVKTDFGQIIFNNEEDRSFNFILRGAVMIFVKEKDAQKKEQPKFYKRIGAGEHFGEKMQFGREELESVRSVSPCYLLQLDMTNFYNAFAGHFKYDELRDRLNFLKSIWVFSKVKRAVLERILLSSENNRFYRNHVLYKEGDSSQFVWVIMEGEVTLYASREGRTNSFCVLTRSQVCGVEQIMEDRVYDYSAVCTSDCSQILKVQKQLIMEIIARDIEPEIIDRRRQLNSHLRQKHLDFKRLMSVVRSREITLTPKQQEEKTQLQNFRKRYKSQGGYVEPLDKMKILNELFKKQVQLKDEKIRSIRLSHIREVQDTMYSSKRLSTYVNNSCTYDKEIIVKYLGRKEKRIEQMIRKQKDFQTRKLVLVPELKVDRSSAVKNQKRKLKNSRRHYFSSLQVL